MRWSKVGRMKKFAEWTDAEEWAQEADVSLEPIGTYTGDERIVDSWKGGNVRAEVWERTAEVVAIGERTETVIHIVEYIVVTHTGDDSVIDYADDYNDAMNRLAYIIGTTPLPANTPQ